MLLDLFVHKASFLVEISNYSLSYYNSSVDLISAYEHIAVRMNKNKSADLIKTNVATLEMPNYC